MFKCVCSKRANVKQVSWEISQIHTLERTETGLPVRMLSFTMQLPLSSTASHAMMQPCGGIIITSPGTRQLAEMSSQAETCTHFIIKKKV